MSDVRFADFDAWQKEQEQKGPQIKVGGKVHQLPPDLPASVALRVLRAMAEAQCEFHPDKAVETCKSCVEAAGAEVSNAEVADMVEQVLGDAGPAILPHVGMSSLSDFLMMVVRLYTGESGGPNRETRRAMGERGGQYSPPSTTSETGVPSSPISSESTESTPQPLFEKASAGADSDSSSPT
jgi:hypothetical protein